MILKFKKLSPEATLPKYMREGDAGLDIASIEKYEIEPGDTALVKTGLAVELPRGYEIQVRPRSGLALKHAVTTLNAPGTIDSNYRGEINVILINHGKELFRVEKGMRIAQLVVARLPHVTVKEVSELSQTERAEKGFGSSGN